MFHTVAEAGADSLIARGDDTSSRIAWKQVYRALDHGTLRSACLNGKTMEALPTTFRDIAAVILRFQSKRHLADYDPDVQFSQADAIEAIDDCEAAILAFAAAPEAERRAFVAFVLFKTR
ncbi:hypothetical protein ASG54_18985 [Aureimonas sp. Leaf460]|nr:hypothetical protein ASG62_12175 [Aureimonas sp. Leaf427]KQT71583.1 hypothetical protein ASG54_18985 [Aureimonas sp. Leaf460]